VFATTTALDFAPVFRWDADKQDMVRLLFEDHVRYGAVLHAYVIMANHIHFISRLPEDRDVSWFVQRLKTNSARVFLPRLDGEQRAAMALQQGLNGRSFWQRSFRSYVILSEAVFWQKVRYIHLNPVRAGLVELPEDYAFSSAGAFSREGGWDEVGGVRCERVENLHTEGVEV
jgi:putative transposase